MSAPPRHQATSGGGPTPRVRLPTVQEALLFSPLSSIVPFSAGEYIFPVSTYHNCFSLHPSTLDAEAHLIPLLHPDVIPFPEAVPTTHPSRLLSHDESALAERTVTFLNSQATVTGEPSVAVKDTLRTLQQEFLDRGSLTRL